MKDPIVKETRARREKIGDAFGHDLHGFFEWMKRHGQAEKKAKRHLPIALSSRQEANFTTK